MKYFMLPFLFLLLSPFHAPAAAKISKESLVSQNKKRTYYLFVPESAKAPAPLVVLLHGSQRNGLSLVEKWKDLAEREGVIVVGPDSLNSAQWSQPADGPDFLHDLVEALKAKHRFDARRVYLFGHSAGAVFAINMSLIQSEYFAATAVHAGAWRRREDHQVISYAKRKIPLALWVGTNDQFFPLKDVRSTRDSLQSGGIPVELYEMAGHDHWYYDLAPQINRDAWEFLEKHALPADPHYEVYAGADDANAANVIIQEVRDLQIKINELLQQLNAKDLELKNRDFNSQRAEIARVAQEEVELLRQISALWRSAAEKTERAARLRIDGKYQKYLGLLVKHHAKRAEAFDALQEQAKALLAEGESFASITEKRSAAEKRFAALQQEADELEQQATRAMQ